ncbi:hypothetical protein [Chitinimonas naiadis]
MEFATANQQPKQNLSSIALVVLLHAGLVYGLLHGLKTGQVKLPDTSLTQVSPLPEPSKPEEAVARIETAAQRELTIRIPVIPDPMVVEPHATITTADIGQSNPDTVPRDAVGQQETPVVPLAHAGPVSASVACSNYLEIRDVLADKLPLVAERMDFSSRGINQFDMVAQLTVGPAGEISNPLIKQSSNAYASRAMESSVLSSLRKLKCAGQGQARTVQVPLNFSLVD